MTATCLGCKFLELLQPTLVLRCTQHDRTSLKPEMKALSGQTRCKEGRRNAA